MAPTHPLVLTTLQAPHRTPPYTLSLSSLTTSLAAKSTQQPSQRTVHHRLKIVLSTSTLNAFKSHFSPSLPNLQTAPILCHLSQAISAVMQLVDQQEPQLRRTVPPPPSPLRSRLVPKLPLTKCQPSEMARAMPHVICRARPLITEAQAAVMWRLILRSNSYVTHIRPQSLVQRQLLRATQKSNQLLTHRQSTLQRPPPNVLVQPSQPKAARPTPLIRQAQPR